MKEKEQNFSLSFQKKKQKKGNFERKSMEGWRGKTTKKK